MILSVSLSFGPPVAKCVLPVVFSSLSTFPVSPFLDRLKTVVLTVMFLQAIVLLKRDLTVTFVPKKPALCLGESGQGTPSVLTAEQA